MNAATETTPAQRYYGALLGSWSGALRFAVTDGRALRALPASTSARVMLFATAARVAAPRMATTLAATDDDARAFRHTTRVTHLGMLLFETEERIAIGDDGARFRMSGVQRAWPARAEENYASDGVIDGDAQGASYLIPWFGVELTQRTHIEDGGLLLTQETAWSRAEVRLRRA